MEAFEPNKESIDETYLPSSLRKEVQSIAIDGDWQSNERLIFKERPYTHANQAIRDIWEWNHFNNYVKYL